jgi:hypothetical protein
MSPIAPTAPVWRRARRRQGRLRCRFAVAPLRYAILDRGCARRSATNAGRDGETALGRTKKLNMKFGARR